MSKKERKALNLKGCELIQSVDPSFPIDENTYDGLRRNKAFGFAYFYLIKCWDQSDLMKENEADVTIYKQLLEIDSKLGTTQAEQLWVCVFASLRMDLIKVCVIF